MDRFKDGGQGCWPGVDRVLMLSMTDTVLCGPRAVFRADVPGVRVQTDVGNSPRMEPQKRSEL